MGNSRVDNISDTLGRYMLKGWVLTDSSCPTPGCTVPLMRSPNGRTHVSYFCANCNVNSAAQDARPAIASEPLTTPRSSPSLTSSFHATRSSTPPTEISSTLSSPIFDPPVDTEESLHRRQQSDTASAEIGKRLLKGWAMLADECPNVGCYGVPLVRPPKTGADPDPRKECVICGTVYVSENDTGGLERPVSSDTRAYAASRASPVASGSRKGKEANRNESLKVPLLGMPCQTIAQGITLATPDPSLSPPDRSSHLATLSALKVAEKSLEMSLHTLSERLTSYSTGHAAVDSGTIAQTADAIGRVAYALSQVKQVQKPIIT